MHLLYTFVQPNLDIKELPTALGLVRYIAPSRTGRFNAKQNSIDIVDRDILLLNYSDFNSKFDVVFYSFLIGKWNEKVNTGVDFAIISDCDTTQLIGLCKHEKRNIFAFNTLLDYQTFLEQYINNQTTLVDISQQIMQKLIETNTQLLPKKPQSFVGFTQHFLKTYNKNKNGQNKFNYDRAPLLISYFVYKGWLKIINNSIQYNTNV